jgi:type I restriction-modification system DNA methylase subunit
MSFDFQQARPLLQKGNLAKLFVEVLGWEPCHQKLTLRAGETDHAFAAVAEKRGFIVWLCSSPDGRLPDHTTRLKLDRALTQTSFEHLIVFAPTDFARQSWMWVRREPGRPLAARMHEFCATQPGDALLQKLRSLYVSLEEEEKGEVSTVAMAGRARAAFDIEKVTKAFYRDFDAHRKAFCKFIEGIGEVADREWYASVMLNRLMFVYFIQRKGFLDGDDKYLRNRLQRCQKEKGKDKFYTFYRYFLLRLFHEGFGKRRKDRAPDLEKLLGNIPYLNGGLFDVHELETPERYGGDIQISDKAFERIFDYFDQYQWHLDERPLRADNEINPDVLGYIFEKYINQKQMGAYYTKEDITEYISKNTVLPFLFDSARAKCKVAFESHDGPTVWDLLRENPDRYIYSSVRHGAEHKLPPEIAAGVDTHKPDLIERRKGWNKPAPVEYALPTEIWREVVARRQRYQEVRKKLAAGEVREINDFITLNLDLRQFAQDVIQSCEGPDLLMAFWQAISTITVLDPTGGSGAFIFAALNILEPLYEACLDRMEAFLAEWGETGRKAHPNYSKKFTEVLANVDAHPNRRYFVLKSIILNNLYAVDIMEEAVEICKLRLFLKLAAQVEADPTRDNLGIEPLPDIDFNIRAGNTLVGYATANEVRRCMKEMGGGQMKLMDEGDLGSFSRFNTRCADVEQAFATFRRLQTEGDGSVPYADKRELQKRLRVLEEELNHHLAGEYEVKVSDKIAYAKWLKSHQPFHWFIQFYGIIHSGGFDVVIGNPPYLDLKQLTGYSVKNYTTLPTKNLYPLLLERSLPLTTAGGRMGFIVPVSSISTEGYSELQNLILKLSGHFSSYDDRPSRLFDGLEHIQLTIHLLENTNEPAPKHFVTECYRWSAIERPNLFPTIEYENIDGSYLPGCIPKLSNRIEHSVLHKVWRDNKSLGMQTFTSSDYKTFYSRKVHNFLQALDFVPQVYDGKGKLRPPSELKEMIFAEKSEATATFCILNSTLFRWFINVFSDCRHVNKREVEGFRCDLRRLLERHEEAVVSLGAKLSKSLEKTSEFREMKFKHDHLRVQCIIPKFSKTIIDDIDALLASHYGFTAEELDFILNYDIKYRLGRDAESEDE